jgi:hypothetical protein
LRAGLGVARGAQGVNAVIESDAVWTIVVVTNFDPPTVVQLGGTIYRHCANYHDAAAIARRLSLIA